jgi:hypothetical protein
MSPSCGVLHGSKHPAALRAINSNMPSEGYQEHSEKSTSPELTCTEFHCEQWWQHSGCCALFLGSLFFGQVAQAKFSVGFLIQNR